MRVFGFRGGEQVELYGVVAICMEALRIAVLTLSYEKVSDSFLLTSIANRHIHDIGQCIVVVAPTCSGIMVRLKGRLG